jgi:DNA helicase-2/ATP-dependent DNA helicase PcrA
MAVAQPPTPLIPALFPTGPASPVLPRSVSATALVAYARCPLQCYWTVIEPRRRAAGAAALIGGEVHRWIEQLARRQPSLFDVSEVAVSDPPLVGRGVEPTTLERLQAAFLASPYAELEPLMVEQSFAFSVAGCGVRGRVDAVYERDGRVELVDFKTGRPAFDDDPGAHVQLDVYALAAVDVWRFDPDRLRTTYCYLDRGELVTRDFDAASASEVRTRVAAYVEAFGAGEFDARPGPYCRRCDFADECPAVRR